MATLDVTGRMTFPTAPGGADTPMLIGAPEVTSESTTGAQVTYEEKAKFEYKIAPSGVQTVDFGSVADGKFVYVGTDLAITYKVNGGTEVHDLGDGGFMMWSMASITALELTNPGVLDARPIVLILGD